MRARFLIPIPLIAVALAASPAVLPAQSATPQAAPALTPRPLPQGTSISAAIDSAKVVVGDRFSYRINIDGNLVAQRSEYPPFAISGGFQLLSGPNTQTKMTIEGGRSSQSTTISFLLQATRVGEFTIPPTRLLINGSWYSTNEVLVRVTDVPKDTGDLSTVISAKTGNAQNNRILENNYFARTEIPQTAYVGQAIPVDVFIYRNPEFSEFVHWELMQNPQGDGFLFPDLIRPQITNRALSWSTTDFAGRRYVRTRLFTAFAIPTKSGEMLLVPPLLRIHLPAANRNPSMDDIFGFGGLGAQTVPAELAMRAGQVQVKQPPAPPSGAIQQIIGEAAIKATADRTELLQHELLTLALTIRGEGFFDIMSRPELPPIPGLAVIDTSTQTTSRVVNGMLLSEKEFDYVFQAGDAGEVTIPALTFAVFDPKTETQTLVSTEPINVRITADPSGTVQLAGTPLSGRTATASGPARAQARELGRDVAYIDTAPLVAYGGHSRNYIFLQPWFWALQILPILLSVGYGVVVLRSRRGPDNSPAAAQRRARKAASQAVAEARGKLSSGNRDEFYAALSHGLTAYAAALMHRSPRGLTMEEAERELIDLGHDPEAVQRFAALVRECDAIRYSPRPDTPETRGQAIAQAEAVVAGIENKGASA